MQVVAMPSMEATSDARGLNIDEQSFTPYAIESAGNL